MNARLNRLFPLTTLIACGALMLAPGLSEGHVSVHPNTIPEGAFVTLNVRVPGEQEDAYADKVDVLLPPGLVEVETQPIPGWSVRKVTSRLSTPIQTDDGPVDEQVSRVIWTGDRSRLGRLEDGTFMQFPLSIAMPEQIAGQSLAFKAIEHYSNGKVVHWIGMPDAEFPAATINVTPKGGAIEDVAGAETGPPHAHATGTSAEGNADSSDGLATAALVVAVLGLMAALIAVVLARRSRRPQGAG